MRTRLRHALTAALKARDRVAITALRSALAALDNAEAVSAADAGARTSSAHVAAAASGVGSTEARRRDLTTAEMRSIVEQEIRERVTAAEEYQRAGQAEAARRLRAEAAALTEYSSPAS